MFRRNSRLAWVVGSCLLVGLCVAVAAMSWPRAAEAGNRAVVAGGGGGSGGGAVVVGGGGGVLAGGSGGPIASGAATEAATAPARTAGDAARTATEPGRAATDSVGDASASVQAAIEFTDDAGRTIRLPRPARRIAAGASFAVELLMALEHPPVLRPDVSAERVFPEAARGIATVRISHGAGPEVESIAAARCDLVILHVNFAAFAPNIEQSLGVPVALLEVTSVQDVAKKLELMGRVIGQEERGRAEAQALLRRLPPPRAAGEAEPVRVLALFGTPEAFFAFRQTSYLGSMLEHLGAVNVAADVQALHGLRSVAPLNLEQAVALAPHLILVIPHGSPDHVLRYLRAHPAWEQLEAVRSGRVHVLDEVLFSSNPGPRAPEAMRELQALLHPGKP